jgi:outer membrane receptor protein involved in Fe transport
MNRHLLATTSILALGLMGGFGAMAQDVSQQVEAVTVTGSRVARAGYESPTPLTVTTAATLEASNPSGPGDALKQMPVLAGTSGPRGSTGSNGTGGTFLNLRNLGAGNTLVLVDGQRFVPTTANATVDVSLLPTNLIKRVDIVTGGASAAYGSDAVTGVVNFILDNEFEGFKAGLAAGISSFGDDQEYKVTATYGQSFGGGKGHFVTSAEWYDSKGVYSQIDRPLGQRSCAVITNPAGAATARSFQCDVRSSQANFTGIVSAPNALKGTTFDNAGNPIPFRYGSLVTSTTMVGGDGIKPSFLPGEEPSKRGVFYARVGWDFSNNLSAYATVNYGLSNYEYQIGSYDQNLGSTALTIQRDNAYLPASLRTQMTAANIPSFTLNKYFADLPRTWIQNDNNTLRWVGGLQGKVFGDWSWDLHFENGQTNETVTALWDEDLGHVALAADAVVNPANGQIVCRSTLTSSSNGCVPFNMMGNAGISAPPKGQGVNTATEGQLAYLTGTDWKQIMILEQNVAFNVNGTPFSDWAGDVSLASGVEWRRESMKQTALPYGQSISPVTGVPGPFRVGNYAPQSGAFDVVEGYVETVVPLLRGVPLAQSVDFNGAMRLTNYSSSGDAFTWKMGLTWDITDEFRARATRSHDIRAPNLTELYAGTSAGHSSIVDFVRGSQFVNAQAEIYTQGNPNLKPEDSDTTTLGLVYQPEWLPGFSTSVDAYQIEISNAIASVGAQKIVQDCAAGSASQCAFILRNTDGSLFGIDTEPQNLQSIQTEGVDFESSYNFSMKDVVGFGGDIMLRGLANYVSKFTQVTAGVPTVNLAGQVSNPMWRWNLQVNYSDGPFSFFTQARYTGDGWYDKSTLPADLPQYKIGSQILIDLNIAYDIPLGGGTSQVFFNVTDLFNDQPPPFTDYGSGAYDTLGRYMRTGVRFNF